MVNDNKLKEDFFGSVKPVIATGTFKVDPKQILADSDWDQAFIVTFCTGCGLYADIAKSLAEKIAKVAKVELPADPTGYYFELKSCQYCEGPKGEGAVQLKKIFEH